MRLTTGDIVRLAPSLLDRINRSPDDPLRSVTGRVVRVIGNGPPSYLGIEAEVERDGVLTGDPVILAADSLAKIEGLTLWPLAPSLPGPSPTSVAGAIRATTP